MSHNGWVFGLVTSNSDLRVFPVLSPSHFAASSLCVTLTGLLADRFFGQHAMIVVGAVVMAAGHGFLSAKATFILGLLFIIVGNGCFKPNISARIGKLYDAPQGQGKGVAGPGQKAGMAAAKRDAIDEEAAATFEPAGAKGHRKGDSIQNRRDEAFSIFYCAINLGAFIAPLVVGAIRSRCASPRDSPDAILSYDPR